MLLPNAGLKVKLRDNVQTVVQRTPPCPKPSAPSQMVFKAKGNFWTFNVNNRNSQKVECSK